MKPTKNFIVPNWIQDICSDARLLYGTQHQEDVALEEFGELIAAVLRFRRKDINRNSPEDKAKLIDELADGWVVLIQLILITDPEKVDDRIQFKFERLRKRISNTVNTKNSHSLKEE